MSTNAEPTAPDLPTLRVRGPADLVQAIPYLLGFHPVRSLVVVGMAGDRVVVTVRADLTDLATADLLSDCVRGLFRGGARDFVGAVFDDDAVPSHRRPARPLPWFGVAEELADTVSQFGGSISDIALISQNRMWSYVCKEPRCCPPEGTDLAPYSAVAAAATYAGLVALPDRESVARLLDPEPDAAREGLRPQLDAAESEAVAQIVDGSIGRADRSAVRALFAACRAADRPISSREHGARGDRELSDEQVTRFAVALQRIAVRDSLWMAIDDGRLDGRPLWRQLARRVPTPFDAPALFLFGWCSYRCGDGALASIAAQRAIESDPSYSAADLLLAALTNAVDPRRLPKLRNRH